MYDKCYFCWDQLPKLKKESTASFFVNFGRNRGTKEPAYITVLWNKFDQKSNFRPDVTSTRRGGVKERVRSTEKLSIFSILPILSTNFTKMINIFITKFYHRITNDVDGARSVATADVDGDGDLDILSASCCWAPGCWPGSRMLGSLLIGPLLGCCASQFAASCCCDTCCWAGSLLLGILLGCFANHHLAFYCMAFCCWASFIISVVFSNVL